MDIPDTQYAKSGDVHIAYQVFGEGKLDLVLLFEMINHIEWFWEEPRGRRLLERLARFARVIVFDKLGTGLSDPLPRGDLPTFDHWMDDMNAVVKAAGSESPVLVAWGSSGPLSLVFAATYPNHTHALILINAFARMARADDHPWGIPAYAHERAISEAVEGWGSGVHLASSASPALVGDKEYEQFWRRLQRLAATPGTAATLYRMAFEMDARHVLPIIRVPTLVMQAKDDTLVRAEHGRQMAEKIPGARYFEYASQSHAYWIHDANLVLGEIEEFLTGVRGGASAERVFAIVMFTDIENSTPRTAELGDQRWIEVLDSHERAMQRQVERFSGSWIKSTGDGMLATFDRPTSAIQCATAIQDLSPHNDLSVRVGLHGGEIEIRENDIGGLTVVIARRICDLGKPGEILVSSTVRDLVAGSGFDFSERGTHALKGVPGEWSLLALV